MVINIPAIYLVKREGLGADNKEQIKNIKESLVERKGGLFPAGKGSGLFRVYILLPIFHIKKKK